MTWTFTSKDPDGLQARVAERDDKKFALTFWERESGTSLGFVHIIDDKRKAFTEAARRLGTICKCGEGHPDGTSFFVSCFEDEGQRRSSLLLGPYTTHVEALVNVQRARDLAYANDHKSHWYSFGTCSILEPTDRKGVFGK